MSSRNHQRGLTLIEILVVVAVLAILASLALPLHSTKPRSKQVACLNNMKQVDLALHMYANDMKAKFPDLDKQLANDGPVAMFLLSNYLHQTHAFLCPYVAAQREKDRPFYHPRFVPQLNKAFFVSNGNDYAYYDGLSLESATNAVLAERFAWTDRTAINSNVLNHSKGDMNIGFADGHVEWIKPNIIIGTNLTPPWSKALDPIRVP